MGKSSSKDRVDKIVKISPGSANETESPAGDTKYEGKTPRVPKDSFQGLTDFPNTPITGNNNSIDTCSSKRNETTTGSTQNHGIRPGDNIFGNKDNTHFNVNTNSAGYSKRNDITQSDQLDNGPVSQDKSDTASGPNEQTVNSENYEQTNPMAKEDEKETNKKKKKKKRFGTSVKPEPSKPMKAGTTEQEDTGVKDILRPEQSEPKKAECWLSQEENTDGKNKMRQCKPMKAGTTVDLFKQDETGVKDKMSVAEQQVKTMTMEAERLAKCCGFHIEMLKTDDDELRLCPKAFISSVEKYILNLRSEKDYYLNRLSSVAGARLTDNNPNITNLHDPDRPMKLAEKFNKIYDDEWTNMIERLEKKGPKTEEHKDKCVYHLYSVLIVIFNSLSKKAEVQLKGLAKHLFLLTKPSTEQINATWYDYKEERVQLIASRKKTAETTILMLYQTLQEDPIFVQELHACSPPLEDVMFYDIVPSEYFKKCVEICWHFVIQDPPMYVENVSLKGTKIDKDTHKVYTKSGDIVKYHVWPALYLHHQDGTNSPQMGKGVVQPE